MELATQSFLLLKINCIGVNMGCKLKSSSKWFLSLENGLWKENFMKVDYFRQIYKTQTFYINFYRIMHFGFFFPSFRRLTRTFLDMSSNTTSTFCPVRALVSKNAQFKERANSSPFSVGTSRSLRSLLFPTNTAGKKSESSKP